MNGPHNRGRDLLNLSLGAACMARIGPLITKTRADISRRRENESLEPKPHKYLRDRCFDEVTPSSRCSKEHFHQNGEFCDEFGVFVCKKDVAGGERPLCKAVHYHSWFSKQVMREALKAEKSGSREKEEDKWGWRSLEDTEDDEDYVVLKEEEVEGISTDSCGHRFSQRVSTSSSDIKGSDVIGRDGDAPSPNIRRCSTRSLSLSSIPEMVASSTTYAFSECPDVVASNGTVASPDSLGKTTSAGMAAFSDSPTFHAAVEYPGASTILDSRMAHFVGDSVPSSTEAPQLPVTEFAALSTNESRYDGLIRAEPTISLSEADDVGSSTLLVPASEAFGSKNVRSKTTVDGFEPETTPSSIDQGACSAKGDVTSLCRDVRLVDRNDSKVELLKFRDDGMDASAASKAATKDSKPKAFFIERESPSQLPDLEAAPLSPPLGFRDEIPSSSLLPNHPISERRPSPASQRLETSQPPMPTIMSIPTRPRIRTPPESKPLKSLLNPPSKPMSKPMFKPKPEQSLQPIEPLQPLPKTSSKPPSQPSVQKSPIHCKVHVTEYHRKIACCKGNCIELHEPRKRESKKCVADIFRELPDVVEKSPTNSVTRFEPIEPSKPRKSDPFRLVQPSFDSPSKCSASKLASISTKTGSGDLDAGPLRLASGLPRESSAEKLNRFFTREIAFDGALDSSDGLVAHLTSTGERDSMSNGLSARGLSQGTSTSEDRTSTVVAEPKETRFPNSTRSTATPTVGAEVSSSGSSSFVNLIIPAERDARPKNIVAFGEVPTSRRAVNTAKPSGSQDVRLKMSDSASKCDEKPIVREPGAAKKWNGGLSEPTNRGGMNWKLKPFAPKQDKKVVEGQSGSGIDPKTSGQSENTIDHISSGQSAKAKVQFKQTNFVPKEEAAAFNEKVPDISRPGKENVPTSKPPAKQAVADLNRGEAPIAAAQTISLSPTDHVPVKPKTILSAPQPKYSLPKKKRSKRKYIPAWNKSADGQAPTNLMKACEPERMNPLQSKFPQLREGNRYVVSNTTQSSLTKIDLNRRSLKGPPYRPPSPPRPVRDRRDPVCVRIVNVPQSVSFDTILKYLNRFSPALTRLLCKDVVQASFATSAEASRFCAEFDWKDVEKV